VSRELFEHYLRDEARLGPSFEDGFTGAAGGAACGDLSRISLLVADERIAGVSFDAEGCGATRAATAAVAEMVDGEPVIEAARIGIGEAFLLERRGELPALGEHLPGGLGQHAVTPDQGPRQPVGIVVQFGEAGALWADEAVTEYVFAVAAGAGYPAVVDSERQAAGGLAQGADAERTSATFVRAPCFGLGHILCSSRPRSILRRLQLLVHLGVESADVEKSFGEKCRLCAA